MWRSVNTTLRRGNDHVVDCGAPTCMHTPTHPELWDDLHGEECPADGDTNPPATLVFGTAIRPLGHGH